MPSPIQDRRRAEVSKVLLNQLLHDIDGALANLAASNSCDFVRVSLKIHPEADDHFLELKKIWSAPEAEALLFRDLRDSFRSREVIIILELLKKMFVQMKDEWNEEQGPWKDSSIESTAIFVAGKVRSIVQGTSLDSFRVPLITYLKSIDMIALFNLLCDEDGEGGNEITTMLGILDSRSIPHQLLLNVEAFQGGSPSQLPTKLIHPTLYDQNYQSREHIIKNIPKDNSKKNQKKKAGRKAKKLREIENGNDSEKGSDVELEEKVDEWVTVIDSNLAVFAIDD